VAANRQKATKGAAVGAAVAQLAGHQPGNYEVPGLVPGFDSRLALLLCFLGQETSP